MHDDIFACVILIVLKLHNAFHMHRGNLEIRCECMTRIFWKTSMIAKGISQDDFPENEVGRQSNRSFGMRTMTVRKVLQHIRLGG